MIALTGFLSTPVFAANMVHVSGQFKIGVQKGFLCRTKPADGEKIVIRRNSNPRIYYTTYTNREGYFSFNFNNLGGGKFSVYPNFSPKNYYKNIKPCKGRSQHCSYKVNLTDKSYC